MAYKINENCVSCMACVSACPVEAIIVENGEVKIDPEVCIDCGACEPVCHVEAIEKGE